VKEGSSQKKAEKQSLLMPSESDSSLERQLSDNEFGSSMKNENRREAIKKVDKTKELAKEE